MPQNMLIVHGGGPTAVMNCSLFGAIDEAKKSGKVGKIYGALGGMSGVLTECFVGLDQVTDSALALLTTTPGSAIGTSRDAMEAEDYAKVAEILKKYDIRYALFNGGNGTMDTCGKVYRACKEAGLRPHCRNEHQRHLYCRRPGAGHRPGHGPQDPGHL